MTNRSTWEYYDRRSLQRVPGVANAVEYWRGLGVECTAADVSAEADQVKVALEAMAPASFADIGCGPGTFTAMLRGTGVAVDQSANALARIRRDHHPVAPVRADAMALPFADGSFGRALASHLYGLLQPGEAAEFLAEAHRVARQVVILDAGRPAGVAAQEWQERSLPDGSRHRVFRRHFAPQALAEEIGGSVVFGGSFYVIVVAASRFISVSPTV